MIILSYHMILLKHSTAAQTLDSAILATRKGIASLQLIPCDKLMIEQSGSLRGNSKLVVYVECIAKISESSGQVSQVALSPIESVMTGK